MLIASKSIAFKIKCDNFPKQRERADWQAAVGSPTTECVYVINSKKPGGKTLRIYII